MIGWYYMKYIMRLIIYRHSRIDEGKDLTWPEICSKKPFKKTFSIVEGKEKSNNKIVTSARPNVYPAPQPNKLK